MARAARPFMLIAWIALTCGIALGRHGEPIKALGWGRFLQAGIRWRTPRLMPWLIATALLHSALATEKAALSAPWTPLLLAIAGFSMSC